MGAVLAAIALTAAVNGLDTEALPMWRQLLFPALAVLAYLHGRHWAGRYGAHVLLASALVPAGIAFVSVNEAVSSFLVLGVFVMLPWFAGRYRRQQVELYLAEKERAARLERERELVAQRVQAQERARIAADLHDSVGHDLALIALRAGALELAPGLPEANREAAAALRANAVEATDRLRQALGLLRDEAAPVAPFDEPVRDLVDRAAAAGLDVRLEAETAPTGAVVDRAVYRIVQEALTNAAKHAPGCAVAVRVERAGETVQVAVVNEASAVEQAGSGTALPESSAGTATARSWTGLPDSAGSGTGMPAPARSSPRLPDSAESGPAMLAQAGSGTTLHGQAGSGTGLAGLAERVRLLGGTFSAGPRDGGFAVEAEMPLRGDA
ncbi:sensor histidine kinase [Glycomyces endophyticus]